jgi:hypothetical protein
VDLTRAIGYRGFELNSITMNAGSNNMVGCEVRQAQWQGVDGVGYDEKRALGDGFDASDVYLSKRVLGLSGGLYGRSRGEFYDHLQDFVTAFTPTNAYNDEPGDRGYLPLDYWVPTADKVKWPTGLIHKQIYVRPMRQPSVTFNTDAAGGDNQFPLAITWDLLLEARDPRVYDFNQFGIHIESAHQSNNKRLINNKGDYPTPLNIMIVQNSNPAGIFHVIGTRADLTITFPAYAYKSIFQYSSADRIATWERGGVEALRMDMLTWKTTKTDLLIPPGVHTFIYAHNISPTVGSRMWFRNSWA